MKIVQIIYSLDIGGIEVFAGNLAGCFAKDGDESTVVMLSKGRDTRWCGIKKKEIEI